MPTVKLCFSQGINIRHIKKKHQFLSIGSKLTILNRLEMVKVDSFLQINVERATLHFLTKKLNKDTIRNFATKLDSENGS